MVLRRLSRIKTNILQILRMIVFHGFIAFLLQQAGPAGKEESKAMLLVHLDTVERKLQRQTKKYWRTTR